jgi:TAT (twin-arginine translocation) pathway signal sequence
MKEERGSIKTPSSTANARIDGTVLAETNGTIRRRSFLKGLGVTGAAALVPATTLLSQGNDQAEERSGRLRTDADLAPDDHIQAIANTAGFHFAFIEQGGTSLYPSLAQRVTGAEVLRILLSIGPTETAHFQTWHDKAGNARPLTDPTNGLVFPNLNMPPFGGEDFQTNLIMPEPVPFLSRKFPVCSIIRPTETKGAAMGAMRALAADGLFIGQSKEFVQYIQDLAEDADDARRGQRDS